MEDSDTFGYSIPYDTDFLLFDELDGENRQTETPAVAAPTPYTGDENSDNGWLWYVFHSIRQCDNVDQMRQAFNNAYTERKPTV
jgi:hypothetical protein